MFRTIAAIALLAYCAQAQVTARPACQVCEEICGLAAKDRTLPEFEHDGRRVCEGLHAAERIECVRIMSHAAEVYKYIHEEHHTPTEACTKVHACKAQPVSTPPPVEFIGKCDICELVIGEVEKLVTSDTTEGELKSLLDDACKKIPFVGHECEDLVNEYIPELLKDLVNKLPASKCCADIHLCSSAKKVQKVQKALEGSNGFGCTVCKLLIGELEKYVQEGKSEQEIIDEIEKLCKTLGPLESTCDDIVQKELPALIKYLVNEAGPPDQACAEVGLC